MKRFNRKEHWENIYKTKHSDQVSWYETAPSTSLKFINSLNLPKTAFPMRAQLAKREPERLAHWQSQSVYACALDSDSDKIFYLHDGPPYANGRIHNGHALNKILKDIIMKSQRMAGNKAPYTPGWDCHGLPIELQVEKKEGKPGHKLSARAFRQACMAYAEKQVGVQKFILSLIRIIIIY